MERRRQTMLFWGSRDLRIPITKLLRTFLQVELEKKLSFPVSPREASAWILIRPRPCIRAGPGGHSVTRLRSGRQLVSRSTVGPPQLFLIENAGFKTNSRSYLLQNGVPRHPPRRRQSIDVCTQKNNGYQVYFIFNRVLSCVEQPWWWWNARWRISLVWGRVIVESVWWTFFYLSVTRTVHNTPSEAFIGDV